MANPLEDLPGVDAIPPLPKDPATQNQAGADKEVDKGAITSQTTPAHRSDDAHRGEEKTNDDKKHPGVAVPPSTPAQKHDFEGQSDASAVRAAPVTPHKGDGLIGDPDVDDEPIFKPEHDQSKPEHVLPPAEQKFAGAVPPPFSGGAQKKGSSSKGDPTASLLNSMKRIGEEPAPTRHLLDRYTLEINKIIIDIKIVFQEDRPVPIYFVSISNISDTTKIILEKIRQEFVSKINLEDIENFEENEVVNIRDQFKMEIRRLIHKYFPSTDDDTTNMLVNYLIEENLGLGKIEVLLKDPRLEEIVINNHAEPVWVYHRKYGWLETNIKIVTEARIRHYSTMIGREVGKEITTLNPLMDAHLHTGDRVNATLAPISSQGNTITIRKFAADPWTITKFIKEKTISYDAAALIWLAIQNELSVLIAGGTGSGKTSMLNVISNFFPPNQRIISIEDTRELVLPKTLHWVPMETRLPNPEGKGGVQMIDLLVNSLRMRPDRIMVGEIRRRKEAEVLLEAMHTGHSVYGTIHANNADETITRLTNPPIEIPKPLISAISLIVVQNRNRRTGKRRTLQIAEMLPNGDPRVLLRLNVQQDTIEQVNRSETTLERLKLYTGLDEDQIFEDLNQKKQILQWLVDKDVEDVHKIGLMISKYYMGKLKLE